MLIEIPDKLTPIINNEKRFVVIYGGRGSAKSWSIAQFLLAKGFEKKRRFLCTREVQNSIKDSVHKLLSDIINTTKLENFYTVKNDSITGKNGTEFIFKGLRHNPNDIKSTEGIDYAWVEEAHSVSRKSLEILTPTIRKQGSQIIFTYNPTNDDDPVHVDYTLAIRDDTLKIEINYSDNYWFPDVLRSEMEYDRRVDYDKYLHKWAGQCVKHSEAQIFYGKWEVDRFDATDGTMFYQGADWGFSVDPTAAVRCYIDGRKLYIDYESYGVGIDIDATPRLFESIPNMDRNKTIADSARPETINYMRRAGFNIVGAKKGKGSVEDGIEFLRSFEKIIIHERCTHVIDEFRNYCWKVDNKTGEISTIPDDRHNHCIDALRYALEPVMKNKGDVCVPKISAFNFGL